MKLVKQQLNGRDRVVLKQNASFEDLRAEAARLHALFGYDVKPDPHAGRYVASHRHFSGKYLLALEPE